MSATSIIDTDIMGERFGQADMSSLHTRQKIDIRFQSGKRGVTLIEGLDEELDLKRIMKAMKKKFNCACSLHTNDETGGDVLKLQGDHREEVRAWLIEQEIVPKAEAKDLIVVHGY
jgi:translation initiation factor 1